MNDEPLEIVRGSGNVYRDFGQPNAGLEQARAIIAAKIIDILDERKLSTRDAEKQTGGFSLRILSYPQRTASPLHARPDNYDPGKTR